jgi:hypothetical protein
MILFQGGQSFDGGLYVSTKEAGSAERQIIFTSYGSGRATIRSGAVAGLEVSEVAGVAVTNLNFIAGAGNDTTGIYFHAGMADHTLSSVHIRKVDVRGYGHDGVTIIASGAGSTINDVKVEQSNLHDNLWSGISVTGTLASKSHNYLIDRVRAFNNTGLNSGKFVTGNGIYVANVEDATVQRCLAFNNGAKGVAPVGIWSSGSNRITFQYNESYDNRTNTVTDGGGV